MGKKHRSPVIKVSIRLLLSLIAGLYIYYIPPLNPLIVIAMIFFTSYVIGMWISLFFRKSFVAVAMIYTVVILGFSAYGILDVINAILVHILLFMMILLLKKEESY